MNASRMLLDPAKYHDDIRLLRRAMKQRWEISEEARSMVLGRLLSIVTDAPDDKTALKAIAELRAMESQNQKDEHCKAVQALEQLNDRLAGILHQPTIGGAVTDARTEEAEGSDGEHIGEE